MYWRGEPFKGVIVSRREVGKDVVFAIAVLSNERPDEFLSRKGIPYIQMAVARNYNVRIDCTNANNYRNGKENPFTFVLGRKRASSPVEILSIQKAESES